MSQAVFTNPIVSAGPTLVGVGNGTLSVDRLTHFTITQDYTLTCIAKSPDTLFAVSGSLDGAIGIATVGTQFFDEDLKIFLTIQQGSTVFEVGDQFTLSVENGTDLNQENIDEYDEVPQKNFGVGSLGLSQGDHNLRYSNTALAAYLYAQGLKLTADAAGFGGDAITFQLLDYIPAVAASRVIQDLTYTADTPGAAGNGITIEYVGDGLAGLETVGVIGQAITVHIESGVSTATQVKAAVDGFGPAAALVDVTISGLGGNFQTAIGPTNLQNGEDDIGLAGFEFVSVVGNDITVNIESGVSTAAQIKTALDASIAAAALISVEILSENDEPQFAMPSSLSLQGGRNKNFAFNHNEQSDSGNFAEGNANVRAKDLDISGRAKLEGQLHARAPISLDDQELDNLSGPAVYNTQRYINRLIQNGHLEVYTSDGSFVSWISNQITFSADLLFVFRATGVENTLDVLESPVPLSDGESLYVLLNPEDDAIVDPFIATIIPKHLNVFRIATRFGSLLYWFNGSVFQAGESGKIGNNGSTTTATADSVARRDSSANLRADKMIVSPGTGEGLDVSAPGDLEIGASVGANDVTIGGASSEVVIPGNLTVNGTQTILNTATLEVEDQNILVNNGGNDASAQGAGITVERTGTHGSLAYDSGLTSRFKIGDLAAEVEIATVSGAQVITNKDIDGGVAANTRRITLPQDTLANLMALTRKEGTIVYATDTDTVYIDDGSTLIPIGSGSGSGGGLPNFVGLNTSFALDSSTDRDAETTIGNWAAYKDAAGATPVDMTGGTPTVTIARSTSAGDALNGSAVFLVTKDAANRQGEGVSLLVNIPKAYRGRPCTFVAPFRTTVGTLASGDVKAAVFDVTNTTLLTAGSDLFTFTNGYFVTFFTPASTTEQIRIGLHFASTSTVAQSIVFDDVGVFPREFILNSIAPSLTKGDILIGSGISIVAQSVGPFGKYVRANPDSTTGIEYAKPFINYVDEFDAETAIVGWATYADAAGTSPVDGTGGSPNVTFTRSSSSPIRGANSFLFTKDAANRQGQGASYPFTIDAADKAKVLRIRFDYILNSGTFVAGAPGVDSDVTVWIYDVTNGVLIQPSNIKLFSNNTSISDEFQAEFQTASNSTSYRLILHVASTSASAYELKLDNFNVSPSPYLFGTPVTDWKLVTLTATWTTNTTITAYRRRVGDEYEYMVDLSLAGAPTATSLFLTLPASDVIDTAKIPQTITGFEPLVGFAKAVDNGVASYPGTVSILSSTQVRLAVINAAGTIGTDSTITQASPFTFGSGDKVWATFRVPIVGLSSSVQTSDNADTRIVAARYKSGTGQGITSTPTIFDFGSKEFDTHSAVTVGASWKFTAPVAGFYRVSHANHFGNATWTAGATWNSFLYKNGSVYAELFTDESETSIQANRQTQGTTTIYLNAGDFIDVRLTQTSGGTENTNNDSTQNYIDIERLTGPSAIAATETVAAKCSASTSGTASTTTPVNFDVKQYDTHGAVTTGSGWKFTAPVAGKYGIKAFLNTNASPGADCFITIYKNASVLEVVTIINNSHLFQNFATTVHLNAGDFIDLRSVTTNWNYQGNTYGSTANIECHLEIERIGN